jgi:hypothetical protein
MPPEFKAGQSIWVPKGHQITVAGHQISGGMLYVGTQEPGSLRQGKRYIDPALPVAATKEGAALSLNYYPDYRTISPQQRRDYLTWLAGGRCDPKVEIGYVFLFYYGLEQRIATLGCSIQEEFQILEEIMRLRGIYASNRSFENYSLRFCDALLARQHCRNPALAIKATPDLEKFKPTHAMRHIAAIARCLTDKITLDFPKVYVAAIVQELGTKPNSARLGILLNPEVISASKIRTAMTGHRSHPSFSQSRPPSRKTSRRQTMSRPLRHLPWARTPWPGLKRNANQSAYRA